MTGTALRELAQTMGDAEFLDAMERFERIFSEYRVRLPSLPGVYTRTRLEITPRYEVVAMQWAPGSISPIHDHGASRCWVLLLEGSLDVENFERVDDRSSPEVTLRDAGRLQLREGDVDLRSGPSELHRVQNRGTIPAYSLQLYAEPITSYTIVDPQTKTGRIVSALCDLELAPP